MRDVLAAVRWRDALDIFLVSLIVYRLFVALRGTRAAQMLIGLGVLLAASLVARRLELYTIETRENVQTTPVDVAGHQHSVTQAVGLAFSDSVSAVNQGKVQVTVDIQAEPGGLKVEPGGLKVERGTALETEGPRK